MEREYHPEAAAAAHEEAVAIAGAEETAQSSPKKKKKNKMKNKRRFGDEQIRLLESIFKSEMKLEPRRKLQLARELGLQPRQIDIWFQNRRARWKSKQIEQDYKTLKADYDNLASKFESLKKEKQSLILQMEKLSELVAEPDHEMQDKASNGGLDGSSSTGVGGSDYGEFKCNQLEAEAKTSFQQAAGFEEWGFLGLQIGVDDDRDSEQADAGHKAGEEFLSIDEYRPPSPHKLYGFDSAHMTNSQGFNFWI